MTFEPRHFFRQHYLRNWGDLMASDQFEVAVMSAMTAMQMELPVAETPEAAAANHYRMDGVKRFVFILRNLAESQVAPARTVTTNLNHKA